MNLRHIKYFIAVAEEKNISRAAEKLHISQPPLSRLIQSLEDELNTPLFRRTSWGVELTPAGESFLAHAKKIHTLFERTREEVINVSNPGVSNTLHIGLFGTAMLKVVPDIISLLEKTHPEINVVLHHQPREQQIESLRNGKILAAFDRYHAKHENIATLTAHTENMFLAVHKNSPLADRPYIEYAELQGLPMIGPIDSEASNFLEEKHRQQGIHIKYAHRGADMVAGVHMVSNNYGYSIVPESLQTLKLPDVVYIPLKTEGGNKMELHCAYMEDNPSPLLAILIETIEQYREDNKNKE